VTFLKTAKEIVRAWYSVDRIRVLPSAGRLLQLKVGHSIVVRNELYTVRERKIDHLDGGGLITLGLIHAEGEGTLTVPFDESRGAAEGRLTLDGESSIVFESDIAVRQLPAGGLALPRSLS